MFTQAHTAPNLTGQGGSDAAAVRTEELLISSSQLSLSRLRDSVCVCVCVCVSERKTNKQTTDGGLPVEEQRCSDGERRIIDLLGESFSSSLHPSSVLRH